MLIPTFARPAYLEQSLRAALASTFADIEVVVGDDGVQGGRVCETVADARVRYRRNPRRLGIAGNWGALLDDARGELVALCMDDDRFEPGFLERCVSVLDAEPDVGVAFANHWFTDDRGDTRLRASTLSAGRHERFATLFLRTQPVAVSAAVWRRELWPRIAPLPDTGAADMVLFGRLAEQGVPFYYVDEPLMRYRLHGEMFSGQEAFRDDLVEAWRTLSFSDPEAESERRRLLAESLFSRAKLSIAQGRSEDARRDLAELRATSSFAITPSHVALALAARVPWVSAPLARLARLTRRLSVGRR